MTKLSQVKQIMAKSNQGKLNMVKMCITSFQILFVKYIKFFALATIIYFLIIFGNILENLNSIKQKKKTRIN